MPMLWIALLSTTLSASSPSPRLLWTSPSAVQFAVETDTTRVFPLIRAGILWPGTPVLVATTGPARVEWAAAEPPARVLLPPMSEAAEAAPVASIDGEGYFRSQHITRVLVQPLQRDQRGWVVYPRITVTVTFPPREARRHGQADPLEDQVLLPLLVNGGSRPSAAFQIPHADRDLTTPPDPSCKLIVDHRGLYKVTEDDLAQAGVSLAGVRSSRLRLWYQGLEQRFMVEDGGDGRFDAGDYLVFYGDERSRADPDGREVSYVSEYSREATYWLSWAAGQGLRWAVANAAPVSGDPVPEWYWERRHTEQENVVFVAAHNEAFNNELEWYWQQLNASTALRQFTLAVDEVAPADSFVLRVGLQGGSTGIGHHTQFFVTGTVVGESWWGYSSGREALVFDSADSGYALPPSLLRSPSTVIGIKELTDGPSGASAYIFLNWIELFYPRYYVGTDSTLAFAGPQGSSGERCRFAIRGFADADVRLVNVTRGEWLAGAQASGDSIVFSARTSANDLMWIQHASVPDSVRAIVPYIPLDPSINSTLRGADYVIVTHPSLRSAADSLADLAAQIHGVRTEVHDVGDIYDNFSWGELHPMAIRDFLECAYETWQPPAISMAVMMGDACWDFLGYSGEGTQPNLVPTWGNPGNDYYFARLTHDGAGIHDWIPDIATGRLPARSSDEALRLISREAQYLQQGQTSSRLCFVAHGSSDSEQQSFATLSQYLVGQRIPGELLATVETVYADLEGAPGQRSYKEDFAAAWKRSPLLVHFLGRGDFFTWCMELHTTMPDTLTNSGPHPFLIGGSCHSGRFALPDSSCLGELALWASAAGSGSIGMVSSTGITSITQAYVWSQYALPFLLAQPQTSVGASYLAGVLQAGDFLSQRYVLLGDPGLRLARPTLPDLAVPSSWLMVDPTPPSEGDIAVSLAVTLRNQGCMPAAVESCVVSITDSSAWGVHDLDWFRVDLPMRTDTTLVVPWVPAPLRGTHRISVRIDDLDEVMESDDGNNWGSEDIMVTFDAPDAVAPLDCELMVDRVVQLVVTSLPNEASVEYRFQIATEPGFETPDLVYESESTPVGEFYTTWSPPPLPERVVLFWRCRAEDGTIPGKWSHVRSFEVDRLAALGGWRQHHGAQFAADSLWQCIPDMAASCVTLAWSVGGDIARTDSGASVVSTSSVYPGFSPANLIGSGFFIFGNNDANQSAIIDLGRTVTIASIGTELWSGAMDRGVWSLLELSTSSDGSSFHPGISYGPYPVPNVEIPARTVAAVDPPRDVRYIRARYGAGCPHPEALWGSRVYEVSAYPVIRAGEGIVVSPVIGPASQWLECSAAALLPETSDSILVTVEGYSLAELSWEPLQGLCDLAAPGVWMLNAVESDTYPWIRMVARLVCDAGAGPSLIGWDVLFAPR